MPVSSISYAPLAPTAKSPRPTVINQIDTSGTQFADESKKRSHKRMEYSREELGAILKFGASSIFNKSDADLAKMEEMDLDSVMNNAEAYDTATAPTGTSLGGEEFLQQFAVQDVKADMSSWDDIIPLEDRERMSAEEKERKAAEAAAATEQRRRTAAQLATGHYAGGDTSAEGKDQPQPEQQKPKKPAKSAAQRSLELKDKDIRALMRAAQRFGDIRQRFDVIVKDAKLENKNPAKVIQAFDDLVGSCRRALIEEENKRKDRIAKGEDLSKEKVKATLITHKDVTGINAETVTGRVAELRNLHHCECHWSNV